MSWLLLAVQHDDGLTIGDIVHDIPHDPAAFFVYALVALFIGLIWLGSRQKQ